MLKKLLFSLFTVSLLILPAAAFDLNSIVLKEVEFQDANVMEVIRKLAVAPENNGALAIHCSLDKKTRETIPAFTYFGRNVPLGTLLEAFYKATGLQGTVKQQALELSLPQEVTALPLPVPGADSDKENPKLPYRSTPLPMPAYAPSKRLIELEKQHASIIIDQFEVKNRNLNATLAELRKTIRSMDREGKTPLEIRHNISAEEMQLLPLRTINVRKIAFPELLKRICTAYGLTSAYSHNNDGRIILEANEEIRKKLSAKQHKDSWTKPQVLPYYDRYTILSAIIIPELELKDVTPNEVCETLTELFRQAAPEMRRFQLECDIAPEEAEQIPSYSCSFRNARLINILIDVSRKCFINYSLNTYKGKYTVELFLLPQVKAQFEELKKNPLPPEFNTIRIPNFSTKGLTVPEVLKLLEEQSRQHDPEKKGVKIIYEPVSGSIPTYRLNYRYNTQTLGGVCNALARSTGLRYHYDAARNAVVFSPR